MIKRILFAILVSLSLLGCAQQPARTIVRTVEVKVPVYVRDAAPFALRHCGLDKAPFKFYPSPDGSDNIYIREEDQVAFQKWVGENIRCIRAWRQWENA